MNCFAETLRNLRDIKGTLQKDIAVLLNVTVRQYQRYETGVSEPSINNLIALADFFDVSLDYLVGRSEDSTRH